ncbi:uncharacterized protein LOC124499437 [Dermatophagoides farinae]
MITILTRSRLVFMIEMIFDRPYLPIASFDRLDSDIIWRTSNHSIYVQYISEMSTTKIKNVDGKQQQQQQQQQQQSLSSQLIIKQIQSISNESIHIRESLLLEKISIRCQILANSRTSFTNLFKPFYLVKKIWEETKNRLIFGIGIFKKKNLSPVPSSDGQTRQYWMKDFYQLNDSITMKTNGRIRIFEDEIQFRSVEYDDSAIYTCADLSNTNGIRFLHFRLIIRSYDSNWLQTSNPIAMMKITLLFIILFIILPWTLYRYQNFDKQQVRKYYKEMKVRKSVEKKEHN